MEQAMGWDGKPIPYWLNKFGLGQEYKCEICRNHSYWGKRAFERHFQEWRHRRELRRLGILDKEKKLNGITSIEEAKQLWKRQGGECEDAKKSNQAVAIPPRHIRRRLERVALIVSKRGLEHERVIMAKCGEKEDEELKFLKSSNPYHAFYQQKVTEYKANPDNPHPYHDDDSDTDDVDEDYMVHCHPSLETHQFTYTLAEELITAKELDTIKLAAEFWARYGKGFSTMVDDDARFGFMKPPSGGGRFTVYKSLVSAYLEVLHGPSLKVLKQKLTSNAADIETVLENCYHRLQWERFHTERFLNNAMQVGAKLSKLRPPPPQVELPTKSLKIETCYSNNV